MGMPSYQTFTSAVTGTAVFLDWTCVPFNASFAVEIKSGTATFGVQFTLDDPDSSPTWIGDVNVPAGTATTSVGNYMFPVRAVRCVVSAIGGTTQFAVLQGLPV